MATALSKAVTAATARSAQSMTASCLGARAWQRASADGCRCRADPQLLTHARCQSGRSMRSITQDEPVTERTAG